jgi:hypothetical protein
MDARDFEAGGGEDILTERADETAWATFTENPSSWGSSASAKLRFRRASKSLISIRLLGLQHAP